MPIKKSYFIILMILFINNMSGCASVPETSETDGIRYAEKENQESVADTSGKDSEDEAHVQISEDGTCKVSLGTGTNVMNIDTTFADVDYSKVKTIEAKPLNQTFDPAVIKDTFFGGADTHEIDDIEAYDEEKANNSEGIIMQKKTTVDHAVHLENQDGTIIFSRSSDANLFYVNSDVETKYSVMSKGDGTVVGNNVNDQYTIDMAWEEMEAMLSAMGIRDMQLEYYEGCADGGEVYYSMEFTATIGGLPIAEQLDYGTGSRQVPVVYGTADVGTSGVGTIYMDNMLWEESNSKEAEVMEPEQLLKVLEEYVNSGEIPCSSHTVFNHVELAYMLTTDDWKIFVLQPVWRIYIPLNEIDSADASHDIVIDAVTGGIIWCQ